MDNLCIDLKSKKVKYEINQKQEPILMFCSGKSSTYKLNDETLDKFYNIISNRSDDETDVGLSIQNLIETKIDLLNNHIQEINAKLNKLMTKND